MNKQEFINKLREKLSNLPQNDVEEHISFYSEMIEDRIEDGFSEDDAIKDLGSVDEVASQIIDRIPITHIVKEKIKPKRRMRGWEIALLAIGSPVWFSLAASAFAVIISLYASLWAVVISFWAAFASFGAGAVAGVVMGIGYITMGKVAGAFALFGGAFACVGLFIFAFYGCRELTKITVRIPMLISRRVKGYFVKRGEERCR